MASDEIVVLGVVTGLAAFRRLHWGSCPSSGQGASPGIRRKSTVLLRTLSRVKADILFKTLGIPELRQEIRHGAPASVHCHRETGMFVDNFPRTGDTS